MTDLHDLFETARGALPPAPFSIDELTERGRRARRRRSWGRGLAATAAAVAVAGVAVPIAQHKTGETTPAAAPAVTTRPFTFSFGEYKLDNYRVAAPSVSTTGYQVAAVFHENVMLSTDDSTTTLNVGSLTVYQPGVFQPGKVESPHRTTVSGKTALEFTTTVTIGRPKSPGSREIVNVKQKTAALAWQYAHNAWAVLESRVDDKNYGLPLTVMRDLVPGFHTGPATTAAVPYTVTIPAGWDLTQAGTHNVITDAGSTEIISEAVYSAGGTKTLTLWIVDGRIEKAKPCRPALLFCDLPIAGTPYYAEVEATESGLTPDAMMTVAHSLTVDRALDQPASWHPVR